MIVSNVTRCITLNSAVKHIVLSAGTRYDLTTTTWYIIKRATTHTVAPPILKRASQSMAFLNTQSANVIAKHLCSVPTVLKAITSHITCVKAAGTHFMWWP